MVIGGWKLCPKRLIKESPGWTHNREGRDDNAEKVFRLTSDLLPIQQWFIRVEALNLDKKMVTWIHL